jgi:predicted RNA binding protein YcfA (HicA-like mRNA interferase family)
MAVDYGTVRTLTARVIIRALTRDGFLLDRQSGSHRLYRHSDGRRVTVTFHHPAQTFAPKTLRSMIEHQARWSEADLRRLRLIR